MLKLNPQGLQEIRKYPQAAGHLKYIREKYIFKMLKLNPQGPQEIRKYPQAEAGHLKYIRKKHFLYIVIVKPAGPAGNPQIPAVGGSFKIH